MWGVADLYFGKIAGPDRGKWFGGFQLNYVSAVIEPFVTNNREVFNFFHAFRKDTVQDLSSDVSAGASGLSSEGTVPSDSPSSFSSVKSSICLSSSRLYQDTTFFISET